MESDAPEVLVPMPTRGMPLAEDPRDKMGVTLVDVANEKALKVSDGIVVVEEIG